MGQEARARIGVAVAAISARVMTESIVRGGGAAHALDLFGDVDTRAAACEWRCIGRADTLRFDDAAFLDALAALARQGQVCGWVAGSGFEARPDLIARGASILPLLGNAPELVRRIRTPGWFYPWLLAQRVAHADVRIAAPEDPPGWLVKDARACGGWHVRPAAQAERLHGAGCYFQRRVVGESLSVLFLADGLDWALAGIARQIIRPLGGHDFVYRGGVGPVALSPTAREALGTMLDRLVPGLGLRGLNGIDFVLQDDEPVLIELNPRPTASVALFDHRVRDGLMRAHVAVCRGAALAGLEFVPWLGVRGSEVVFARGPGRIDAEQAVWLAERGWCHDLPAAGTHHAYGDPVCTVSAEGDSAGVVEHLLAQRRHAVRDRLARADAAAQAAEVTGGTAGCKAGNDGG